ncbi:hypothetical protein MauCBS54593_002069 [Microsporum audouinii]
MQQLSEAIACLEAIGHAHGDINSRNIMFTEDYHLKLIDIDHALKLGDNLEVGDYPYVRLGNAESGGTLALLVLTLNNLLWDLFFGIWCKYGLDLVDRLITRTYPEMDLEDLVNQIISGCWKGKFKSIAELVARTRQLAHRESLQRRRAACESHSLICDAMSDAAAREASVDTL